MDDQIDVYVRVNGEAYVERVPARLHAADFLRHQLDLTGTHVGCEQGACGMCTVLVDGRALKSCLMLAAQLDEREVETVESLADGDELNPLQQAFKEEHGLQCGFCTPGFLMTATALRREGRRLSREDLRDELAGVLCRCTGYEGIVRAAGRHLNTEADWTMSSWSSGAAAGTCGARRPAPRRGGGERAIRAEPFHARPIRRALKTRRPGRSAPRARRRSRRRPPTPHRAPYVAVASSRRLRCRPLAAAGGHG